MVRVVKRLAGPIGIGASATTIYTVPSATIGVITHIHVINRNGSTQGFAVYIGTAGIGTMLFNGAQPQLLTGQPYDWYSPGAAMSAAEILQVQAATGTDCVFTVFGYEIILG